MPGYPLLLAAVFLVAGRNNLVAADAVQQVIFVVSALQVYVLGYRVWRSTRFALIIGLLYSSNFIFLSYVKALLSDGLALLLTVGLALACTRFIEAPRPRRLWIIAALLLALTLTRAEWFLLAVPLFLFLLLVTWRQGSARRLVVHSALAMGCIFAVVAICIVVNARVNNYTGLTDAQNINLYGKVTQYHIQNEAPPEYTQLSALTNAYVALDKVDPWYIYRQHTSLGANHFATLGSYARAIILEHPVQYLGKSSLTAFRSLYEYWPFARYDPAAHGAGTLHAVQAFSGVMFPLFMLFPLMALGWFAVLAYWLANRLVYRAAEGQRWIHACGDAVPALTPGAV